MKKIKMAFGGKFHIFRSGNMRKKTILCLCLCALLLNISTGAFAISEDDTIKIYVSTEGEAYSAANKDDVGTLERPISLNSVYKKIRYVKSQNTNKEIQVVLRGGDYVITDTVSLESRDSGYSDDYRVVFTAYENEVPCITGAKSLDAQSFLPVTDENIIARFKEEAADTVLCADLTSVIGSINGLPTSKATESSSSYSYVNLYFNGKEQPISQWPNGDGAYSDFEVVEAGTSTGAENPAAGSFRDKNTTLTENGKAIPDAYAMGYFGRDYRLERVMIESIQNNIVSLARATDFGITNPVTKRWKLCNVLDEIDSPGEWYIDRQNMKLYYYPPYNFNNSSRIELSTFEGPLFSMNKTSNITFKNLKFSKTRGHAIVNYLTDSSNMSENVTIENCTFENIGGFGIDFHTYQMTDSLDGENVKQRIGNVQNLLIKNNIFYNMWLGAWNINSGDAQNIISYNTVIENNYANQPSYMTNANIFGSTNGVGIKVRNNLGHNGGFQALTFSGSNNEISNNAVYASLRETLDCGTFYIGRTISSRNNLLTKNFIYQARPVNEEVRKFWQNKGIYFDDGYSASTVDKNIVVDSGAAMSTSGNGSVYTNNISVDCADGIAVGGDFVENGKAHYKYMFGKSIENGNTQSEIELTNNYLSTFPQISAEYNALEAIDYNSCVLNNVSNNYFVNGIMPDAMASQLKKDNNTFSGNIKTDNYEDFVDADNLDFRIKNSSSAYTQNPNLLSEDFNLDSIGIQWSGEFSKTDITGKRGFNKLYPEDNYDCEDLDSVHFAWEKSFDADEYTIVISTDSNLKNVVFEKTVPYNYCDVEVNSLNGERYYWNVYAENITRELGGEWIADDKVFTFSRGGQSEEFDLSSSTLLGNRIKLEFNKNIKANSVSDNIGIYYLDSMEKIEASVTTDKNIVVAELPNDALNHDCKIEIGGGIMDYAGNKLVSVYTGEFNARGFFEDFDYSNGYTDGDWIQREMNGQNNLSSNNAQIVNGELYLYRLFNNTDTPVYVYKKDYMNYCYDSSVLEFDYTGLSALSDGDYNNKFGIFTKLNNSNNTDKAPIYNTGWFPYVNSAYLLEFSGANRDLKIKSMLAERNWIPYGNTYKKAGNLCVTGNKYRFRVETFTKPDGVYCNVYKAAYAANTLGDYSLCTSGKLDDYIASDGSFAFGFNNAKYESTYYNSENKIDNCFFAKISELQLYKDEVFDISLCERQGNDITVKFSTPLLSTVEELNNFVHVSAAEGIAEISEISLSEDRKVLTLSMEDHALRKNVTVGLNKGITNYKGVQLEDNRYISLNAEGVDEDFGLNYAGDWKMRAWGKNVVITPEENGMILPVSGQTGGYLTNGGAIYKVNYSDYDYADQTLYFDYMRKSKETVTDPTVLPWCNFRAFIRTNEFSFTNTGVTFTINGGYFLGIEKEGTQLLIGKINGDWSAERQTGFEVIPASVTELKRISIDTLAAQTVYSFKLTAVDTADGKVKITAYIKDGNGVYTEVISATDATDVISKGSFFFTKGTSNWGAENFHYIDNISYYNDGNIIGEQTDYENNFTAGVNALTSLSIAERKKEIAELENMAELITMTNPQFDNEIIENLRSLQEFIVEDIKSDSNGIKIVFTNNLNCENVENFVALTDEDMKSVIEEWSVSGNVISISVDKTNIGKNLILAVKKGILSEDEEQFDENNVFNIVIPGYNESFGDDYQNEWMLTSWTYPNGKSLDEYQGGIKPVSLENTDEATGLSYSRQPVIVYKNDYNTYCYNNQYLSFDYMREIGDPLTGGDAWLKPYINFKAFIMADAFEYNRSDNNSIKVENGGYYLEIGNQGTTVSIGKLVGSWKVDELNILCEDAEILSTQTGLNFQKGVNYSFRLEAVHQNDGVRITAYVKNNEGVYEQLISALDNDEPLSGGYAYFVIGCAKSYSNIAMSAYIIDNVSFYGDPTITDNSESYIPKNYIKLTGAPKSGNSISNADKLEISLDAINLNELDSNSLYVAFFDEKGILSVESCNCSAEKMNYTKKLEVQIPTGATYAKLMLWTPQGTMIPLTLPTVIH